MTVIRSMARGAAAVVGSSSLLLAACETSGANGSLTEIQADGGRVTGTSIPNRWLAHSAYGLQLSVPKPGSSCTSGTAQYVTPDHC